ncbi:MAG TPA: valine--tRNA ligase [bacterium]|nr:valine--tRNA ligase [bacterium]
MSNQELPKVYEPKEVEERWLKRWLDSHLFHADVNGKGGAFSIVIPPPNVTGSLHMGHALNNTLQDILVRYKRMKGSNALWVPGTDHAGIATQNVVERELKKEGKRRQDLGREKFIERVWEWKKKYGSHIVHQLQRLGASCDWERERFTMDDGLSRAVREAFVRLYERKLIFRDLYLINWCPRCHTALSDIEVEHQETNGHLWHIRYGDNLVVATTRPETMLGDTAVAVHPEDERYRALIGKKLKLPLTDREIPVIADHRVDREFGTGAVKVTPAHDFNDFALGNEHKLPRINIFTPDAHMNENGGDYEKMERFEARKKIVADLEEKGLLVKTEPHKLSVGHCYRCRTVVEPYLSLQWFVKTKPLAERALQAVREGRTEFHPENWTKTFVNWMENIKDWCISRQIWWGHRIPAWYCDCAKDPIVAREDPIKCPKCGKAGLRQEEDVLDTWFSSGLWPFSTLGWPDKTPELEKYYPTSVLVTAHDIIFFWVARMMMFGLEMMDEVPFKDVYIHALVRDAQGQKMSKSKGNVIDPLEIMDRFGTDAFRFALAALAAQGRDIKLSEQIIEGYRNFANKVWNASRFAMMNLGGYEPLQDVLSYSPYDHWIIVKLSETADIVSKAIENYEFDVAAKSVYQFFWHDFCDWYLEFSKITLTKQVLYDVLGASVSLLHPFMPFITDEIWSLMPGNQKRPFLDQCGFPSNESVLKHTTGFSEETARLDASIVDMIIPVIEAIRSIRGENRIPSAKEMTAIIYSKKIEDRGHVESWQPIIQRLGRAKSTQVVQEPPVPKGMAHVVISEGLEVFVPLEGLVDFAAEVQRLDKEIGKLKADIERRGKRLEDQNFVSRADPEIVEEERESLREAQGKLVRLEETRRNFAS